MCRSTRALLAMLVATGIVQAAENPPPVPLVPLGATWNFMGNGGPMALPGSCEIGTDSQKSENGQPLPSVRCTNATLPSFGGARYSIPSEGYRGKRVRVSGWLMTSNIEDMSTAQYAKVTGEAGLWIGIGSLGRGTRADRMPDRTLKGSTGWEQREFVVDVPVDNGQIQVGFWMQGKGQVWMRDIKIEEVPATVALTTFSTDVEGPDLSLASRGVAGSSDRFQPPPEKWLAIGGQGFELCDSGVDAQMLQAGQRNLTIACSVATNAQLRQALVATRYWGKRMRFSGWIRSENVEGVPELNGQGGAGIYMTVTGSSSPTLHANVSGTTAWQYRELVMDIPRDSLYIPIGIGIFGTGQVWGRDFKFEEVSLDTPLTPASTGH